MENNIIYITQSGELHRKDNTLFFQNTNTKKVIPIIGIEQIYCLGEITINSKLLSFLTENKINIHFFNYYGYYSGTYSPKESYISGNLLIKQIEFYQDKGKRLFIAKKIVEGIGKNILFLLDHYYRHGSNVKDYIKGIESYIVLIENQNSINAVMGIEGNIWQIFYSSFKEFLLEDFIMNGRVKQPPDNPINALISFGNSLLYTNVLTKIYHTQLNPTISYLHTPFERRFSLSLDIAEIFKPLFTFKTIFYLVNKKMLNVDKHFVKDLNYCILNEEGRKIFITEWDKRIKETTLNPILKRNISNLSLVKLECYKLIKHLLGDLEYSPFLLTNDL